MWSDVLVTIVAVVAGAIAAVTGFGVESGFPGSRQALRALVLLKPGGDVVPTGGHWGRVRAI